jgi:hypothetical protein
LAEASDAVDGAAKALAVPASALVDDELPVAALAAGLDAEPAAGAVALELAEAAGVESTVTVASRAETSRERPPVQVMSTTVSDSTTVEAGAAAALDVAVAASAGFRLAAVGALDDVPAEEAALAAPAGAGDEKAAPSAWNRSSRKVPSSEKRLPADELAVAPGAEPTDEPAAEPGAALEAPFDAFGAPDAAGVLLPEAVPVPAVELAAAPEPADAPALRPICSRAWNTALMKLTRPALPPPLPLSSSLPWPRPVAPGELAAAVAVAALLAPAAVEGLEAAVASWRAHQEALDPIPCENMARPFALYFLRRARPIALHRQPASDASKRSAPVGDSYGVRRGRVESTVRLTCNKV